MTPKQKLEMHKQIVRQNSRKLREWKNREAIRLLNIRIAEEEMRKIEEMGVFA